MPFPARRHRLVHLLAVWSCLLALAVRILLPALHTHTHAPTPASPAAATVACSCGHHHAPDASGPTGPRSAVAATDALDKAACPCFACELEHGVPGAAPPPAPAEATVASARAGRPTDATAVRCKLRRPSHPCRAPPAHTGWIVAAG